MIKHIVMWKLLDNAEGKSKPDFAQWLIEQGIDSISLNPDCCRYLVIFSKALIFTK